AGDEVDAVGFPSMRDRSPILEDAVLRVRSRQAPLPEPVVRKAETVDQQSQDYELIQLRAVLLETQRTESGIDLLLQDGGKLFKASLEDPTSELLSRLKPGSTLSLRGLVLFSFPPRTTQISRPNGFSLLLRTPADVRMIRAAPWWTVRRTFGLFGAAAALALCFGLWNHFLRARAKGQQEIISAQARREATSEERSRLARELHDTLEQEFVGMTRQTEALEHAGLATPRAHEALLLLRQMLRHSRDNARRAVWDLRDPALLDCGVEEAVRNAVQRIVQGAQVTMRFDAEMKSPSAIPPQVQLNLLRLAQEAVTNALKHSSCTAIRVVLRHLDGAVELTVTNDGPSHESSNGSEAGHFGVIGMRERCEKLGGRFDFQPRPEGGATVHATIPIVVPHP
ncbi:MAG TPA: sensor histidine kinase, partial [Chthoniobacteraceae bacterium]